MNRRIPLFDAHCDTALKMYKDGVSLRKNSCHIDLERGMRYFPYVQFFALFSMGDTVREDYRNMLANLKSEFKKNEDILYHCKNTSDVDTAIANEKIAAFITVEGAELLGCDETELENAYNEGVRAVTITWNFLNKLSGSNVEGSDVGLTEAGKSFVRKCQQLGVLVDVSHISDPAFWDVIETAEKPIIATHSNSRTICNHSRNLTDEQFKAIIQNGGVSGINLYDLFVGENANVDTVVAHIDHFLSLGGAKHIGIGADLDGCDTLPRGINGVEDLEKLYDALLKKRHRQELVDDIFFNNLMNLISKSFS